MYQLLHGPGVYRGRGISQLMKFLKNTRGGEQNRKNLKIKSEK
jgi:hypothetical protein